MDDAMASYQLLTASTKQEAIPLAKKLSEQNQERQRRMRELVEWARAQVHMIGDDQVYVLACPEDDGPEKNVGIVGLVAGRIMEEFYRPTLIISTAKEKSRGSARSTEAFHITKALDECRDLLEQHGGHAAAAGFLIRNDKIGELRARLREIAAREITADKLVPTLSIDMALPLRSASLETVKQIEEMQPFGIENPLPVFVSHNLEVRNCRLVGAEQTSLKFLLGDGTAVRDAIAFRQESQPEEVPRHIDVAYTLQRRIWNGEERAELIVKDWRPADRQV